MKDRRFEWDLKKAQSNLTKHGVAFEQAIHAFDDPFALLAPDDAHSTVTERRQWLIGECATGIVVVIFTLRQEETVIRLISARKASRKERAIYEAYKTIPL
jgi:uncharacterized DUF497 family protein